MARFTSFAARSFKRRESNAHRAPTLGRPVTMVYVARVVRNLAYGALSVIFGITLADRGFTPAFVGGVMSFALLSGAASSAFSGAVVRRLGLRTTLVIGAALMILAPLAFALHSILALACAVLAGTLSPGGQEVGPFSALEQVFIADASTADVRVKRYATYNLLGALGLAVGALIGGLVARNVVLVGYACCGGALLILYAQLPSVASPICVNRQRPRRSSDAAIIHLTALFGLDAFAGGFIIQGFLAYWLHVRFGTSAAAIGVVLFLANVLAAGSYLVADRVAAKVGLIRTMVYTHLPSNVVLCIVPLMPTFESAAAVLLLRFAFSQMDVPTRQAFTMSLVAPEGRAYAAGVTNAVRPAAAAFGPVLAGVALQHAGSGLPFFLSGGLKVAYDLLVYARFNTRPTSVD